MSSGQRRSMPDAFASFLAVRGKLTEANHTSADSSDDAECVEVSVASKRNASQDIASSSSLRRGRVTRASTALNTATPCHEMLASTESHLVIEELKAKVFSHDFESLDVVGTATIANEVFNDLLKAMSSFHLVERKLSSTIVEVTHECQKADSLKQQLDSHTLIASKDEAITWLEEKMKDRDLIILGLQTHVAKSARDKE